MPELLLDDVGIYIEAISKSYHKDIYKKYQSQLKLLGISYYKYKELLRNNHLNDEWGTRLPGSELHPKSLCKYYPIMSCTGKRYLTDNRSLLFPD